MANRRRRLGVFGGSFDPVHYGHLLLAETCRESADLDQVLLIPAQQPPHKERRLAEAGRRLAMLRLAISGNPVLACDEREIARGGVSFTVDTLEDLAEEHPDADWFLILGGDSLQDFPNWRSPERILELATLLVASRVGAATPDPETAQRDLARVARAGSTPRLLAAPLPAIEISSTDIRDRVRDRRSIRYRTPRAVEAYIREHSLYVG